MDCLLAKCVPIITDCVMAELEKLGPLFKVALRIARDPRFERLPCTHKVRDHFISFGYLFFVVFCFPFCCNFMFCANSHFCSNFYHLFHFSSSFQGTYADDCIVERVTQHRCYIVATCDKDLKRRIRRIPGVPILSIKNHKFEIERLPDAPVK